MDQYTYINSSEAKTKRCVHTWADYAEIGDFTHCDGEGCMGWVYELDDTGKPTGRGRCGMVQPVLTTCMRGGRMSHES